MSTEKTFAELLVYYRSMADLSQEELASLSGVSKIQIARYETGKGSAPRLRTILKLAKALNVTPEDLGYRSPSRPHIISIDLSENNVRALSKMADLSRLSSEEIGKQVLSTLLLAHGKKDIEIFYKFLSDNNITIDLVREFLE